MRERRTDTRLLCAELVELIWRDSQDRVKRRIGNLEDISPNGICVQLETPIPTGTSVRMLYGVGELTGIVRYELYRDEAYFIGIELEQDSRWSPTQFLPEHLLNPDDLLSRISPPLPESRQKFLVN